jgi:hypothetical protein
MGQRQTKSKAAVDEDVILPIPDLVRQSSGSKEEECIICFDKARKGIMCSSQDHFVCASCFSPYVQSVIEDAGKMMDSKFTMKCPSPGCSATPWTSHQVQNCYVGFDDLIHFNQVRLILDAEVLEKYIDALVRHLELLNAPESVGKEQEGSAIVEEGIRAVIDSLTLGCPFCHTAIDPNPDGCAAMRCGTCSKYFCLLCLTQQADNGKCHSHVRMCPNNPSKNVYASAAIRKQAHRTLQVEAVRRVLRAKFGSSWSQVPASRSLIKGSSKVLQQSDITEDLVFEDRSSTTQLGPGRAALQPRQEAYFTFCVGFLAALVLAYYMHHLAIGWSAVSANNDQPTPHNDLPSQAESTTAEIHVKAPDSNAASSGGSWLGALVVYLVKGLGLSVVAFPFIKNRPPDVRDVILTTVVLLWYPLWLGLVFVGSVFVYITVLFCIALIGYVIPKSRLTEDGKKQANVVTHVVLALVTFIFIYLPSAAASFTASFSIFFCVVLLPVHFVMRK